MPDLVGIEEVIGRKVVLVDGLLHQAHPQHFCVEHQVRGGVPGDRRHMVDTIELHTSLQFHGRPSHSATFAVAIHRCRSQLQYTRCAGGPGQHDRGHLHAPTVADMASVWGRLTVDHGAHGDEPWPAGRGAGKDNEPHGLDMKWRWGARPAGPPPPPNPAPPAGPPSARPSPPPPTPLVVLKSMHQTIVFEITTVES